MDPCPFVRLAVGNLGLKFPVAPRPDHSAVHPSSSPCFCVIKLKSFPVQSATVPYIPSDKVQFSDGNSLAVAATFHLSDSDLEMLRHNSSLFSTSKKPHLKISLYSGRGADACGVNSGRLLGKISVPLDLEAAESRAVIYHSGWITVGTESKSAAQFHLNVKTEPDPRFVFQFDGSPECCPQIFQVRGSVRQPVFSCKFSLRTADRNPHSRPLQSARAFGGMVWLSSFGSERERYVKERKGWSITIHDLSGSPVAAASMVTPFVASSGSDRVTRSNPGCWLILRPANGTWKPWGRLEAWRERGTADGLGYRFEVIPESADVGIVLAESAISCSKGGKLMIELNNSNNGTTPRSAAMSPGSSPRSSGDLGYGLLPYSMFRGFVMSASVAGEGKKKSKSQFPVVEVSVNQVNCAEDAAVFVALSAALDLSMESCRLFSQKLRKELCPPSPP